MPEHFRHYRVASRNKSYMASPFDQFVNEIQKQPILLWCFILLLFLFFAKCFTCNQ